MHVDMHFIPFLVYDLLWFIILYKQKYIILKELIRMGIIILRYNCNFCHNIFICCIVYLFIWWTTLYCAVTTYSVALCPWSTCHSTNLCISENRQTTGSKLRQRSSPAVTTFVSESDKWNLQSVTFSIGQNPEWLWKTNANFHEDSELLLYCSRGLAYILRHSIVDDRCSLPAEIGIFFRKTYTRYVIWPKVITL